MNDGQIKNVSECVDLERYEFIGSLGVGSHGQVFKARDKSSGDLVAIKHISRIHARGSLGLNEFSAILAVDHPCIVPCLDFHYLPNGDTFLVYQYINGGTLRDLIEPGKAIDPSVWDDCTRSLLQALSHLHERHLLHCDLKPENILVAKDATTGNSNFLLSDLGVCRFLESNTNLDFSATPAGAPGYMAPESFYHQYSPASDLYGLGIILFEMATGMLPFEGSIREIARGHLQASPPVEKVKDPVQAEFIRWFLQKSPAARPSSASLALRRLNSIEDVNEELETGRCKQTVPKLPPFSPMESYNYKCDFSINLFSKALVPISFLGRPAIASFQDSHFELYDATSGKALNRFVPNLSGVLQFHPDGAVLTAEPKRLVLWEDDFRLPSTVVETNGHSEAAALDCDRSTAAWVRGERLFIRKLEPHAKTETQACPSAGLRPRIFASKTPGCFIVVSGCTRPEAIWVDGNAEILAKRSLPGPVVEASHTLHPALFCVSSLEAGSSSLVLVDFGVPGTLTMTRFAVMPRCHNFCENGVMIGEEDGAVSFYKSDGKRVVFGVLDDPNLTILVSPRRDFFLTVCQTGHRRRFQLFQTP